MADLKALYEGLGYQNVITYIQSGNVIFDHSSDDLKIIKSTIEATIDKKYGFDVYVDVRKADDYQKIYQNLPFQNVELQKDGTQIVISFLEGVPEPLNIDTLLGSVIAPERLIIKENIIYLHCPNGYGKTKLSNTFIEKKLALKATTRNLKTVAKLSEMAAQ